LCKAGGRPLLFLCTLRPRRLSRTGRLSKTRPNRLKSPRKERVWGVSVWGALAGGRQADLKNEFAGRTRPRALNGQDHERKSARTLKDGEYGTEREPSGSTLGIRIISRSLLLFIRHALRVNSLAAIFGPVFAFIHRLFVFVTYSVTGNYVAFFTGHIYPPQKPWVS
jgi:hypothetical protein